MTTDNREKMRAAVREAAHNLRVQRSCSFGDALRAIVSTYREILEDAVGTSDEPYWQAMVNVANEELAS